MLTADLSHVRKSITAVRADGAPYTGFALALSRTEEVAKGETQRDALYRPPTTSGRRPRNLYMTTADMALLADSLRNIGMVFLGAACALLMDSDDE